MPGFFSPSPPLPNMLRGLRSRRLAPASMQIQCLFTKLEDQRRLRARKLAIELIAFILRVFDSAIARGLETGRLG